MVLFDPEDPSAHALHAEAAGSQDGQVVVKNGVHANGAGSASGTLVQYGSVAVEPTSVSPQRGRGKGGFLLLSLGVGILLAGGLAIGGFTYWWNHLQAPGSVADEEYHAFERTTAQYENWRKEILDRINGSGNAEARPAKKIGMFDAKAHLPPEEAVHACLRRHLPGYVTITAIEPIGYRSVGNAEELDYRVTVESPVDIYVVPALAVAGPPENAPEPIKQVWPDLLWDATLPPGMEFGADEKDRYLLAKADQKFSFLWKVEKAQVVDGKWRIQRVAPPLLEWNNGFLAAGLDNALHGGGAVPPLFLCRGKDLGEYSASWNRCLSDVQGRYEAMKADIAQAKDDLNNEVPKAPGGVRGIDTAAVKQARSDGFKEGMNKGQEFSDNTLANVEGITGTGTIPYFEAAVPFVNGLFHSKKAEKEEIARQRARAKAEYRAGVARHEREAKKAVELGNQYQAQQESRFVQDYRDLASKRVEDIRGFIQRTAIAEDEAGKAKADRSLRQD
ncbi:MAG: hypothetical protein PHO89_01730 [Methylacidiphilaceae bacterium]|nr:hypothetical protein [Candidatus Methylacidiphilaceae bacterium]